MGQERNKKPIHKPYKTSLHYTMLFAMIFAVVIPFVFMTSVPEVSAAEVLTNGTFTGNATGWTLSSFAYNSTTYQGTPAGSIRLATATGSGVSATGNADQTIGTSLTAGDYAYLSLYWGKTCGTRDCAVNTVKVQIAKPSAPTTWIDVWSDATTPGVSSSPTWTSASANISSYITETGQYKIRLYATLTTGGNKSATASAWFDTVSLNTSAMTTIGNGTDPGNVTIAPGASATDLDSFTVSTNRGTDTITGVVVSLVLSPDLSYLSQVDITDTSNVVKCSSTGLVSNGTNSISGCSLPVSTSPVTYKIRITPVSHTNMPAVPGGAYTVTGAITSVTSTNNKSYTDSGSDTVTIDNQSPANVTGASATPGDSKATISWTDPGDSDLSQILILQKQGSSITGVPTEGASYSAGNAVGDATVCYAGAASSPQDCTGLTSGQVYYFRIFAKDSSGNYSQTGVEVSATPTAPASLPTVTTQAASGIGAATATGNGNITDTGGATSDKRGFVYGTASVAVTPGNVVPASSGYANYAEDTGSFSTGAFTKTLSSLSSGTTYYIRAYSHNSAGYSYGNEVSFLTLSAAPTNVSASDGTYSDKVTITWTQSAGATGYRVYRDNVDVSGLLGDVATYDDAGAAAPTITPGSAVATDGINASQVDLSVSGASTSNGATHTYKVVAVNVTGSSAESVSDTGFRGVGPLTYQWQRSSADSNANYSNIVGAAAATYGDAAAPAGIVTPGTASATDGSALGKVTLTVIGASTNAGAGRYYKVVLSAAGAAQQVSAADRGYRGVGALNYQWYRSSGDSDASYSSLAGAATAPFDDTTAPAPTITPGSAAATDGTNASQVDLSVSGASTSAGAGRYFYATVSAAGAASADTNHDRGYIGVGPLTYQWQVSATDSDDSYSNITGGTSANYGYTGAPAGTITPGTVSATDGSTTNKVALSATGASTSAGAGRYYKVILNAVGAAQQVSTVDRGYRGIGPLTYQWYRSSGDSDVSYSSLAGAITALYDDTTAPAPTITVGTVTASDGASDSFVTLSVSGESASAGAGRYFYVTVSAAGAASQDTNHDRGYIGVGPLTYQWQRSAADSDAGYSDITSATMDPYNDIEAPEDGSGRYYKVILNATGAAQQASAADRGYRLAIGIAISGVSNLPSGTVWVAVDDTLRSGKTGTISGGTWSISDVYVSPGGVVTAWVHGAADGDESTAVTEYDGSGDITDMVLNRNTLTLGSSDLAVSLTNVNLGQYDCSKDEDIMYSATGSPAALLLTGCTNSYANPVLSITSGALAPGGNVTATNLTIASTGTYTGASETLTLTGTGTPLAVSGTFSAAANTVNFNPSTTTGITIPALTYNQLNLNKSGNTFTAATGTLAVLGNLNVAAGTFDLSKNDAATTISGNLTISDALKASVAAPLTVSGNFTNNGTFTHNNGTVIISSTSPTTIGGSSGTNFYNLTATGTGAVIKFKAGSTFGISGTLLAAGTYGQPLLIQSDTPGSQWIVDLKSTVNLDYVRVTDAACVPSSKHTNLGISVYNGGNNGPCWGFVIRGGGGGLSHKAEAIEGGDGGGTPISGGDQEGGDVPISDGGGGGTPVSGGDQDGGGSIAPP